MIKSMTGYGRGQHQEGERKFTVEIKSVNHRYNDISIRLARSMNPLEDRIRKILTGNISRGKTDVFINYESGSDEGVNVVLNEPLARGYIEKMRFLEREFDLHAPDTLTCVLRFPDVISVEKVAQEEESLWQALLPALEEALSNFLNMRSTEGNALKKDILEKGKRILSYVEQVKQSAPLIVQDYKKRLSVRIAELLDGVEIEDRRIAEECAIYADRSCVDEEITRLASHVAQMEEIFEKGGAVGRKLDFLVQEMNREANTIASKSNDIGITRITIELKSEIEKIREQIQNIE